jgi:hypothetical protein
MPAEIINLNDSLPAAPAGNIDVKWQRGPQSGVDPTTGFPVFPVSAYVPLGGGLTPTQEIPAGAQDGVNVTFTLSHTPALLFWVINGVIQMPGVGLDFTLAAAVITMTVPPISTDKLGAWYWY